MLDRWPCLLSRLLPGGKRRLGVALKVSADLGIRLVLLRGLALRDRRSESHAFGWVVQAAFSWLASARSSAFGAALQSPLGRGRRGWRGARREQCGMEEKEACTAAAALTNDFGYSWQEQVQGR